MFATVASAVLASLAGVARAHPGFLASVTDTGVLEERQASDHSWQFRGPDGQGVRSPCPGLNTLANHGYINRNGFNITAPQVQQGFLDAFNMAFDVTSAGASNAVNLCNFVTGRTDCTSFDLWMLDTPHQIEHDASLSRADFDQIATPQDNNYDLNMVAWQSTLIIWGGATHIGITQASSAIQGRRTQQRALDTPGWYMDSSGSFFELAFVLASMNDPVINPGQNIDNVQARLDWVDYWVENERLPTALGWVKPSQVVSQSYILDIVSSVSVAPTAPPASGTFYASPNPPATADKRDVGGSTATVTATITATAILGPSGTADLLSNSKEHAVDQMRMAKASAQAGPVPQAYNPYTDEVSVQKMVDQKEKFEAYEAGICRALIARTNA